MLRVGLTGGIGAGKSTVAGRLRARGAVVVDADQLAREVVAPGSEGLAEVAAAFGPEVLADDGSLDRAALGAVVFRDPAARGRLESITHPRIRALTGRRFAAAPDDAVVVHDIPLLVELGYEDRYHLAVVVHAGEEERVRRLVAERGSTEEEARRRVAAQADDAARRRAADVWLDNTGVPDGLLAAVDRLWDERLVPFEANLRAGAPARRSDAVAVSGPDPTWAATGARLAARVARAAGPVGVAVDHVGSTSVPGLVAKDVVDLQLVVTDLAAADAVADRLSAAGFPRLEGGWADTPKPVLPDAWGPVADAGAWAKRLHGSADPGRAVHLHVRAAGSPGARYALLCRDWLRAEAGEREAYAALKRGLTVEHATRTAYAEAKEPWFTDVAWPRMRTWAERTGWSPPV